nr:MAG TPA: ETC complex I subunit conserved region [Caudoviricetes sp.]
MPFWLLAILSILATVIVLPLSIIFLEVVGAWADHMFDRLETAAARFCWKHGWDF